MTEEGFYINQEDYEGLRTVTIYMDDEGDECVTVDMAQVDGKWVLAALYPPGPFAPSYHFSEVSEHSRVTCVKEYCNMVPPDFVDVDPVGMTPTHVNEGFRRIGVEGWTSAYEWSREEHDWVLKEVVE